ncbi:MAG: hypothetical protein IH786_00820 [Proteobacteria bacterium]|nr:hypothetical protein [Pseudomonadota bacterium]
MRARDLQSQLNAMVGTIVDLNGQIDGLLESIGRGIRDPEVVSGFLRAVLYAGVPDLELVDAGPSGPTVIDDANAITIFDRYGASSASDQIFTVNDFTTGAALITITEDANVATITRPSAVAMMRSSVSAILLSEGV